MIEKIIDNIYRIEIPLPGNPLKVLNSYFIRRREKNLIIDTGYNIPEARMAMFAGLPELNADLNKTDIYVTHLHSDHVGLVPDIKTQDSRAFITEIDYDIIVRGKDGGRWEKYDEIFLTEGFTPDELRELTVKNPARAYAPTEIPEFEFVKDGDILEYGGHKLEVIVVAGHTPGNTCLYIRDKKLMFLGDHVLFNITPNIISWLELDNALKCYCDNLKKIREYDVEIPLPAHRAVSCTMRERIDEILEHHKKRLDEALSIVARKEGQNACEIASQMTWKIRTSSNKWSDFPIGQKWFAVGEVLSPMEYLMAEGKVVRKFDGVHNGYYLA